MTIVILAVAGAAARRRQRRLGLLAVLWFLAGCAPSLDAMRASTVRVLCRVDAQISTGSGFVVGDGRHIATNWHNVACATEGGQLGILLGERQLAPARVVWRDPAQDLAILAVRQPLDRPVAAFTTHAHVRDDEAVWVLGFPGAADDRVDTDSLLVAKVSRGGISARVRSEDGLGLYQIDAAINPGHSGGPIFNEAGRIIGISVMKSLTLVPTLAPDAHGRPAWGLERVPRTENIAWAIHIDALLPGLRALGLPFTMVEPGPLEPLARLARREPVAAAVLMLLLGLAATGGLGPTGGPAAGRRANHPAPRRPAPPAPSAPSCAA